MAEFVDVEAVQADVVRVPEVPVAEAPARRGRRPVVQLKTFRVTVNNYSDVDVELVQQVIPGVVYHCWGKEIGPENGVPHLQGFVSLEKKSTITGCQKVLQAHGLLRCAVLVATMGCQSNKLYCSKTRGKDPKTGLVEIPNEWFVEVGEMPAETGGAATKKRYREANDLAKAGKFDELDLLHPDLWLRHMSAFKVMRMDFLESQCPKSLSVQENYWCVGGTSSCKSSSVRYLFEPAEDGSVVFLKPKSKLWPGYAMQPVVIVDDIDPSHETWMTGFLKEWTDHYRFHADVKYGGMVIRPKVMVVTSQYSIADLFKDPETVAALERRFFQVDFGREKRAHRSYSPWEGLGVLPLEVRTDEYVPPKVGWYMGIDHAVHEIGTGPGISKRIAPVAQVPFFHGERFDIDAHRRR